MKTQWKALARRIDGLTLRERVFLFVSVAAVAVALADALVLSPQLALQQTRAKQLAQQNTELTQLRRQLAAARAPADDDSPAGQLRAALQPLQDERARLEQAVAAARQGARAASDAGPGATPRLADLLARVLRRHERLSLVRLEVAPAQAAGAAASSPVALPAAQAVDLALAGPYLDLAAYLAEIQAALPGLRWGPLQLDGQGPAPLLTLRLWLPGEPR